MLAWPAAPMVFQLALAPGLMLAVCTTLVSMTVSPLAVTKSTTIEYRWAVLLVFFTRPEKTQPFLPSLLQAPVVTDFLALSAATYCGTSADVVACAATPLAAEPVAGAAGELLQAASASLAAGG